MAEETVLDEEEVLLASWEVELMTERCGLTELQACELHEKHRSWHEVDDLLRKGCSSDLAYQILR